MHHSESQNHSTHYTPVKFPFSCRERLAVGKLLIERGAYINIAGVDGKTALHSAARADDSSLMEMIINKGCAVNLQVCSVLCKDPNINPGLVNREGFNALQLAVFKGHSFAVDKILGVADKSVVNVKNWNGNTLLHIAIEKNNTDYAKLLIEKGNADINSKNIQGQTPLWLAAKKGCLESVQV
ncbi:hypothetical protein LOTGIDRAFT_169079 [Lottia gigantea]|uniref:Uncharacterized protein n=1 Tax=Lottia gigantea TaxID=225164 RepID=V3ZHE1_LOTGI|nr:hypothetical protein LOTGIDRAFT_169079 [Lottia gigantea]ESO83612.1 hypothetical protein LOTGIDRAFT_169079 [Lottia gigantea]